MAKRFNLLEAFLSGMLLTLPILAVALPMEELHIEPGEKLCYVQAGASGPGNGSEAYPYNELALVEADNSCDVILVMPSAQNDLALDGGIFLDPGQKLFGLGPDVTKPGNGPRKRALITNTNQEMFFDGILNGVYVGNRGAGVILSDDNEVAGVHIDGTWNEAISGLNVSGSNPDDFGAKIDRVRISNAVSSGLPWIYVPQTFALSAASIFLVNSDFTGLPPLGGSGGPQAVLITNSVISDSTAGILALAEVGEPTNLVLDNVTIERINLLRAQAVDPGIYSFTRVFALQVIGVDSEITADVINTRMLDIDNAGNRDPAVFTVADGDSASIELNMQNSILANPSNVTSFNPYGDGSPIARGDGITGVTISGTTEINLTDVLVANAGQDALELETDYIVGAHPVFYTQGALAQMNAERVIVQHPGRSAMAMAQFVNLPLAEEGPASLGDRIELKVSESTMEGAGDLVGDKFVYGEMLLVLHRDSTVPANEQPGAKAHNFAIDLGGGTLDSPGLNRIYGTTGPIMWLDVVDGVDITAQNNWWGTPDGLDPAELFIEGTATVDASNPLQADPRPGEGAEKYNNKKTPDK